MWVVTVHECGGSTAEALDVYASFGGFTNEPDAKQFAEVLYGQLSQISRKNGTSEEWFTQHFKVPEISKIELPRITDPAVLKQLGQSTPIEDGKVALDMNAIAEKVIEQEEFELKPPPPDESEVAAAIASIKGVT